MICGYFGKYSKRKLEHFYLGSLGTILPPARGINERCRKTYFQHICKYALNIRKYILNIWQHTLNVCKCILKINGNICTWNQYAFEYICKQRCFEQICKYILNIYPTPRIRDSYCCCCCYCCYCCVTEKSPVLWC